MDNTISVVIPTYNEKENISRALSLVIDEVKCLREAIVVDDDSADKTWQVVEEISKENNKIKLIRRINKRGLPQAIWEGVLNSGGEFVLWFDADFSCPPLTLARMLGGGCDYDITVASRYCPGGGDQRIEKIRIWASRFFNNLARLILRTKTRDLTSGYFLVKKEVFSKIRIRGLYGEYSVRFLYEAEKNKFKIREVPCVYLPNEGGNSKTTGNIFLFISYCLLYLFTVLKLRLSKNAPQR
jgi:dolichol-phosphate mannosyltransferase